MPSKFLTPFLKTVLCASFFMAAFSASAFTEGADYVVLKTPTPNADKTLTKVFSYDGPFCYMHDKRTGRKVRGSR
ncbi:MAG: hypothetical protein LBP90_04315 [Burkholderiales bacterium]|jgi:thiol:disulfide interchange protein DsbA|nr:hypothetical protein [Burkholderiales bacterium]